MNIEPWPGYAYIRCEELHQHTGGIIIPEQAKSKSSKVGTVLSIALTEEQEVTHAGYETLKGQRIVAKNLSASHIEDDVWRIPVDHIDCILETDEPVETSNASGTERCSFCGNAGDSEQGILMTEIAGKLVCPRCNKDKYGKKHDPKAISAVTSDQAAILGADLPEEALQKAI